MFTWDIHITRIQHDSVMYKKYYHLPKGHLCPGAKTTAGKKQLHFAHLKRRGEIDLGTIVCLSSGQDLQISDLDSICRRDSSDGFEILR